MSKGTSFPHESHQKKEIFYIKTASNLSFVSKKSVPVIGFLRKYGTIAQNIMG